MSNLLQNIGFAMGLLAAPALAYADGVQSGDWVPAGSDASAQKKKVDDTAPRKTVAKKATVVPSTSPCKPCAEINTLKTRVNVLEAQKPGDQYNSMRQDLDRLYEVVNGMADSLNGTREEPNSGLADKVGQLITVYHTLVTRIEKNENDLNDPLLDQVRNTFRAGMKELKNNRDAAARKEFDLRVERNIFGRGRDARRTWFEVGSQVRYESRGAAAGAVVGAVTYRGDKVTVGLGAGAGYGREAVSTVDLTQAPASEQQGEYTQVSSQTGRRRTVDRYRGHLQLRAATSDLNLSKRWAMQVGGVVEMVASDHRVTIDRTRTIQFLSGEQPVGEPHSAHGSDTERSTHYSVVPGMALDFLHDQNRDGRAVGVRLTAGYNATDNRADITLGVGGRF